MGPLRHVVREVLRPLSNEVAKPVDEGSYAEAEPRRNQVKKETKRLKKIFLSFKEFLMAVTVSLVLCLFEGYPYPLQDR